MQLLVMFIYCVYQVLDEINQVMVGISQAANREISLHDLIKRFTPLKDRAVDDYNATVRLGQDVLNLLAKPVLKIEGYYIVMYQIVCIVKML